MSYLPSIVECMNDYVDGRVPLPGKPAWDVGRIPCSTDDPMAMPVEHLEARICALAGHLTAATCQFLRLVADFDERAGWAASEMGAGAGTGGPRPAAAAGHPRRVRRRAAVIRQGAGADPDRRPGNRGRTGGVRGADDGRAAGAVRPRAPAGVARGARRAPGVREPKLTWRQDSTGIAVTVHLPHPGGAGVLQALRAWLGDLDHPHDPGHDDNGPATRAGRLAAQDERDGIDWDAGHAPWQKDKTPAGDLAEAMVAVCGQYLSGRAAAADNPDSYQVIIHAGTGAVTAAPAPGPGTRGVSAETRPARSPARAGLPPWHPRSRPRTC
jgi:hypothetical protein